MRRDAQRGEGKLGFLIALIVVGLAIFLGIKVIPVRVTAYHFKDVLRQEARMGAVRNEDSTIRDRIMVQAADLEIPLDEKNLTIRRTPSNMIIRAKYEQPIDLKFTTYVYKFNVEERAPLW